MALTTPHINHSKNIKAHSSIPLRSFGMSATVNRLLSEPLCVQRTMKIIETSYDGQYFRSRIESRWARFFNDLKIRYEYEKEGYEFSDHTRYLPDFWLPDNDCFVEIKGEHPTGKELLKAHHLADFTKKNVYVFYGQIPNFEKLDIYDTAKHLDIMTAYWIARTERFNGK